MLICSFAKEELATDAAIVFRKRVSLIVFGGLGLLGALLEEVVEEDAPAVGFLVGQAELFEDGHGLLADHFRLGKLIHHRSRWCVASLRLDKCELASDGQWVSRLLSRGGLAHVCLLEELVTLGVGQAQGLL